MQFAKLKLVVATPEKKSVATVRRNKLTGALAKQIAAAKAAANGDTYTAKRVKFVQDSESGERKQVEIATRVKQWWWSGAGGKINLAIHYGVKIIDLAKGRNAIECGNMEELIAALEAVKDAVIAGELDAQIEQASGTLRAGFAKKK
jgi:hypothetical protein